MTDQHPDDDLRRLFADATSDIRPQGTYDDIRSRTEKVDPMARRWFLPAMAAAAVMALVIGGAFYLARDTGNDSSPGPSGTPTDNATVMAHAVPIYFVGPAAHGERLYREFQQMAICPGAECRLQAAVFGAVTAEPLDKDYRMPWPSGMAAPKATFADDQITIDLDGPDLAERPASMTEAQAGLAVQQLVYSAQAGLGKGQVPVRILIAGQPTPTLLGVPAAEPLAAADDVLALVQILSPQDADTFAPGSIRVLGVAEAFEATVVWELYVGGDAVVKSGHTTAAECCTLAPYAFTIKNLDPGTYTLAVHDTDESGEGRPVNQDTKDIVVE
jgi:hypothetical protein